MYLSYIVIVQLAYGLHEGEEVHPAAAVDTGTHLHSDRVIEALSFRPETCVVKAALRRPSSPSLVR